MQFHDVVLVAALIAAAFAARLLVLFLLLPLLSLAKLTQPISTAYKLATSGADCEAPDPSSGPRRHSESGR